MSMLVAAAAFFLGIHLFVAGTPSSRDALVSRLGESGYLGAFSLVSLAGFVWLVWAYANAPYTEWWAEPPGARWITLAATLVAFWMVVVGLTTPNPTATGGESRLDAPDAVRGIVRITRHPFLWGVGLWAAAHLVTNGDAASFVLFGALLGLVVLGTASIDAKRTRRFGDRYAAFANASSNLPFAAIARGRTRLALGEIAWWQWLAAIAVWIGGLAVHPWLTGRTPFPF